jgi:hypothetical protein
LRATGRDVPTRTRRSSDRDQRATSPPIRSSVHEHCNADRPHMSLGGDTPVGGLRDAFLTITDRPDCGRTTRSLAAIWFFLLTDRHGLLRGLTYARGSSWGAPSRPSGSKGARASAFPVSLKGRPPRMLPIASRGAPADPP